MFYLSRDLMFHVFKNRFTVIVTLLNLVHGKHPYGYGDLQNESFGRDRVPGSGFCA